MIHTIGPIGSIGSIGSISPWAPLLVVLVLTVATVRVGRRALALLAGGRAADEPSPRGWVAPFLTGWVVFHLLLTTLQLLGIAWSAPVLTVILGGVWLLAEVVPGSTRPTHRLPRLRPDAGSWIAGAVTAGFGLAALTLRSVHPDFIYHWAVKGRKFAQAGGVDFAYLAHPWNHFGHPDYPTLLPEIYAVTTRLAGGYSATGLLVWAVVVFAGLMAVGREVLAPNVRPGEASPEPMPGSLGGLAAFAVFAAGLGAFSVGYLQAGGADLALTLAFLAAWRPLTARERTAHHPTEDAELAGIAAFAAAVKLEGVILAGILIGLYGLARLLDGRAEGWKSAARSVLRTAWLPVLVIGLWAAAAHRHGLFLETNTGALRLDRLGTVLRAMADSAAVDPWHGLPWVLVMLPVLITLRPTRLPALAAALQLGFYLAVYLTTPVDPMIYVKTSFARLLLPPVTVALAGGLWWLARMSEAR